MADNKRKRNQFRPETRTKAKQDGQTKNNNPPKKSKHDIISPVVPILEKAQDKHIAIRKEITQLNMKELENVYKAFKGIQELPADNPNSFFVIAGYHGEPFVPQPTGDDPSTYWGGWCQHGNVLFPTWHRAYLLRFEHALQTIVPTVTLPYWDWTSKKSLENGIPEQLTNEYVVIDGKKVENPLLRFTLPVALEGSQPRKKGYKTVRCPFSADDDEWNTKMVEQYPTHAQQVDALNSNVKEVLNTGNSASDHNSVSFWTCKCLTQKLFNNFSNTSSAGRSPRFGTPLEKPHNFVHLAVGAKIDHATGKLVHSDMGLNETAAFDPIFWFHHCNVDRLFWVWQKQRGFERKFKLDLSDKEGTHGGDQGATPGIPLNEQLTLDTPLYPFQLSNGSSITSKEVINLTTLSPDYSIGTHDTEAPSMTSFVTTGMSIKKTNYLVIENINKNSVKGSFIIIVRERVSRIEIGKEVVLSRFDPAACKNCQMNNIITATFSLGNVSKGCNDLDIEVYTSEGHIPLSALGKIRTRIIAIHEGDDVAHAKMTQSSAS